MASSNNFQNWRKQAFGGNSSSPQSNFVHSNHAHGQTTSTSDFKFTTDPICFYSNGVLVCDNCRNGVQTKESKNGNKYAQCDNCKLRGGIPGDGSFSKKRKTDGNPLGSAPVVAPLDGSGVSAKLDTLIALNQAMVEALHQSMLLTHGQEAMDKVYQQAIEKA